MAKTERKSKIAGDMIKRLRKNEGLTLNELADIVGTSKSTLSRVERGESNISVEVLFKCSKFFNVPIDSLVKIKEMRISK